MLHDDEVPSDAGTVARLLAEQCPAWSDLPLRLVGGGTDNTTYRLGDDLAVRMPRTPGTAADVAKEQTWLPRLAPSLPLPVPRPVHHGQPGAGFGLPWSVYEWIDGEVAGVGTVTDWEALGADLAGFVRALHAVDLGGARREGALSWYRGGDLQDCQADVEETLAALSAHEDVAPLLDLDLLAGVWAEGVALPRSEAAHGWLHGDLKPSNLLVREGRLVAVIDFGALSVGLPDAEHAPLWDLPPAARRAYLDAAAVDPADWARATAWAVLVGLAGVGYYWRSDPAFAHECLARLRAVTEAVTTGQEGLPA